MVHGQWTKEHDIFVIALRMGTNFNWDRIGEEFRGQFGTPTTKKDLESRWNKNLKSGKLALAVDNYRHSGIFDDNGPDIEDVVRVIKIVSDYPAAERVF